MRRSGPRGHPPTQTARAPIHRGAHTRDRGPRGCPLGPGPGAPGVLLRGLFEQKQIKVSREYGDDVPLILGEANLLRQLFLNLFVNALEAMEPGGELEIRLDARKTLRRLILVAEVTDSGTGVPEDILPQIFDAFFSTKPGGSGLGLSICRSIADAHRASIRARNDVNRKGATFAVEFTVIQRPPRRCPMP